jgi:hypothetical protein
MEREFTKYVAIAKITDPAEVETKCNSMGWQYKNGMIFVNIPGLGLEGNNYVPVRYGLALPYIRIQPDWKILVEPINGLKENWFYTGIVDCGGPEGITPDTDMQLLIQLVTQVIYASADKIYLSKKDASEPFVNGNQLKTWITSTLKAYIDGHTHPVTVDSGTHSGTAAAPVAKLTNADTGVWSTKIFGE